MEMRNTRVRLGMFLVLAFGLAVGGCATGSNYPADYDGYEDEEADELEEMDDSIPLEVRGLMVTREAASYIWTPYASPPNVPTTFDCSSFISHIYAKFGYALPRTTSGIGGSGRRIEWEEAVPGDILIFARARGSSVIDHAAILWRKSDSGALVGSWIIHAASVNTGHSMHRGNPNTRTGIVITELGRRGDGIPENEYFYQRFMYCIRVMSE
jgi:hypothetical protein